MNRTFFFSISFFCFFVLFIYGTVLTKVGPLPCSMLALLQAKTGAHFFDVAKKPLLSEITYDILTRAGPKTFRKKCKKTRPGVPPEQRSPRQDKKSRICVTCKLRDPRNNSHRKWQQESDLARPAPTCPIRSLHFEQNAFFCKKLDFSDLHSKLDARTQLWSVPDEAELAVSRVSFAFLQTFLQK